MQGMTRGYHKRKLTKEEKQMDKAARDFNLLLSSSMEKDHHSHEINMESTPPNPKRSGKRSKNNHRRLTISPITVPGTPDNPPTIAPKRSARFPTPNYEHRNTNYVQPSLTDRLSIDDSTWPYEASFKRTRKRLLTEDQFNFSDDEFPHKLYRVGGVRMVQEYKMRKEKQVHESDEEQSDDSENSLTIYYRACASFKPEQGESNAESAERSRLIE